MKKFEYGPVMTAACQLGDKGSLTNKKPGWGVIDQSEGIKPVGVSEPWPESNELFCDVLFVSGLRLQLTADMSCLSLMTQPEFLPPLHLMFIIRHQGPSVSI